MMEIWLVRHGSTSASEEGRFQGRLEYALSSRGRREAELLAARLSSLELELILSSDQQRARETAQAVARYTALSPVYTPLLRECSWGLVEGLTRFEARVFFPELFNNRQGRPMLIGCGGESNRQLLARASLLLKFIYHRYGCYRRIVLVSHGRFINALLAACFGLKARQRWPYAPSPASLSMVQYDHIARIYRLRRFNDCRHLN